MKLEINSPAGEKAAAVIEKLAHSSAAPADMSVAQEGQAGSTFATSQGSFMVNWTYIYNSYEATDPGFNKDIGYTRYPESVQGEPSRPPYGGIGLGVSAYSNHVDQAMQAVECITSPENQEVNAEITGNMPASQAGYEANGNALQKIYPAPLLKLFQQSLDEAAPRTRTPYWSDISGGLQSTWHPPSGVSSSTPATSQTFIDNVLHGRSLL
jgi:multiple sugar transport system substrate-binding protein